MAIQSIKANTAALAMMLTPIAVPAQTNIKPLNDSVQTIVLDKNSLPQDVFEKSNTDSTTITFEEAQNPIKDKVQVAKDKVEKVSEKIEDIKEVIQDTTKNSEIQEELKGAITKKSPTAAKILFNPNISKEIGLYTLYGSNVPNAVVGVNAKIYNDKAELDGDVAISKDNNKKVLVYGLKGKYFFDMSKGFYVYPKVAVQHAKISYKDDSLGKSVISPTVDVGVKYVKDFDCGIRLVPAAEIGTSLILTQADGSTDYEKKYICQNFDLDFLLMLAMHYKNLVVYVKGGETNALGYNVGGGVNFKF